MKTELLAFIIAGYGVRWTQKYEDIYNKDHASVLNLKEGLTDYFLLYNYERPHQGLNYRTPVEVYYRDH